MAQPKTGGGVVLSPDGIYAAFTVSSTDCKDNSYGNGIWIAQKGQKPFQLTRTAKGADPEGLFPFYDQPLTGHPFVVLHISGYFFGYFIPFEPGYEM